MEVVVALIALPLATGWLSRHWQTVLVWPAVCLGLGALAVADEPGNYDMHGFGFYVGAAGALVAVAAWLAGRLLRAVVHRHERSSGRS